MDKDKTADEKRIFAEMKANCVCFNIRKTARVVTQRYEEVMQPSGLRPTQFNLLVAIALGNPITVSTLAQAMAMDRTTLTRTLKPLESQGLIRVETGEDRRTRVVVLSERGQQALAAAVPLWKRAQETLIHDFGQERWQRLRAELEALMRVPPST